MNRSILSKRRYGGGGVDARAIETGRQSQLRPTRSQATSLGSHSVLMRDSLRSTFSEPHFGHGGAGFVDSARNSSKRSEHSVHSYS